MDRKPTDAQASAQARGETRDQVLDRNVNEVLQEVRVVLTGVQVLFAFLLGLAFTARFQDLGTFGTTVYTVTLLATASATVLLVAPVAFHRTLFRLRRKEELVAYADRSLRAGLALLLVGIASAVLLVLDVALGRIPAVAGCGCLVVLGGLAWYALPLRARRRARGA